MPYTRIKDRWLFRAGLVALGVLGFCATEARAGFNDLLAANIGGGNVTQYDRTTGASLGVFAATPLQFPQGITIGADNNVYVTDLGNSTVQKFNGTTGASLGTFVTSGLGGLNNPHSLVFGPNGDLFVTNNRGNNVLEYNGTSGAFVGVFATGNGLSAPTGLAFGLDGSLYVASSASSSNAILKFSNTGAFVSTFATGLNAPAGVTVAPDGTIFVANDNANNVIRYSTTGSVLNTITGGGLAHPSSVVFDNAGGMFVASSTGNGILRFNANFASNAFTFDRIFATAGLNTPTALALRPVPEPSSVILFGLGLVAAAGTVARRARGSRELVA